jgi:hypothetical protein
LFSANEGAFILPFAFLNLTTPSTAPALQPEPAGLLFSFVQSLNSTNAPPAYCGVVSAFVLPTFLNSPFLPIGNAFASY